MDPSCNKKRWKVFCRRCDMSPEALEPLTSRPDLFEVDLWRGPLPMPREEFLRRVKGQSEKNK